MIDQKQDKYKAFDYLPGALVEIDLSSQLITYMSQIAYSIFGYSQADMETGIHVKEIFADDAEFGRAVEIIKSFGLESYERQTPYTPVKEQDLYDFMLRKKGGDSFYGECQGAFVLDDSKVPVGFRLYIRDLTEQRLMEAFLQESEEKYRTLVENSPDLIFLIDGAGEILLANEAGSKSLKKSPEDLANRNMAEVLPAEVLQIIEKHLKSAFHSGKRTIYEIGIPPETPEAWFSASFNPVKDDAGKVSAVLGVGRNITRQKHTEQRLEQALVEAQEAGMAKDQLIANLSHEFRTPLTSIIGFTDYLQKSLANTLTPKDKRSFEAIYSNSDRLLQTVNAILNFSRMKSGPPQLSPRYLYLNPFLKKICDGLKTSAHKKGLEFKFISKTENDKIWLDEFSIQQALVNIIQNAIKYTDEGSVTLKLKRVKEQLILEISDTGIGIAVEYYKQMYQPFNQESEGLTREYQGLGLGLALAKRYLDWNKIQININSRKGYGSIFTLTFPKAEEHLH